MVAVISLAQMAVDALVADARVIGIWRYSGLQVFVSHFDRHFDEIQRAVVPAALRKKYFSSDCRDRCNKFESSVSNFTLQMETNQNLGMASESFRITSRATVQCYDCVRCHDCNRRTASHVRNRKKDNIHVFYTVLGASIAIEFMDWPSTDT